MAGVPTPAPTPGQQTLKSLTLKIHAHPKTPKLWGELFIYLFKESFIENIIRMFRETREIS